MSPLCTQKGRHIGSLLTAHDVCVYVCECAGGSPNAGLILALRLRRWPNISPVLGSRVVFGVRLNVGQRHRGQL